MERETPTSTWLAAAPYLPPLTGAADTAGRLVLLLHYGIDWKNSWVTQRRHAYWSHILPSRVAAATYRAASLRAWWTMVSQELGAGPRNRAEREELGVLLGGDQGLEVLGVLREECQALTLRCRITADAVRETTHVEEK